MAIKIKNLAKVKTTLRLETVSRLTGFSHGSRVIVVLAPTISVASNTVGETVSMSTGLILFAISVERRWTRDGVDIPGQTDQTYTLAFADKGKSIDGWIRGIDSNEKPGRWVKCFGTVQVPDDPPYLETQEWAAGEATADADTRKASATVTVDPGVGYEWAVSAGAAEFGDIDALSLMTWDGTNWVWTGTTPADPGATVYVRIARRLTATPATKAWASDVKAFVASRAPVLPAWTVETSPTTDGAVRVTLASSVNDGGRTAVLEIEVDGDGWEPMAFGLDAGPREVSGTASGAVSVRLRATNINGAVTEGPKSALPKAPPVVETPLAYTQTGGLYAWSGTALEQFIRQGDLFVWLRVPGGDQTGGGGSGGGGGGDPTDPPDVSDTPSADLPLWVISATDASAYSALIEFTVEDL